MPKGNDGRFIEAGPNDCIVESDGTTRIMLTQGKEAIIDTNDYLLIKKYRWHAIKNKNNFYAGCMVRKLDGNQRTLFLHSIINPTNGKKTVDHKNGDTLNNRRNNLRTATYQQNMMNKGPCKKNTSGHPGVFWREDQKKWRTYITLNNKLKHLGQFSDYDKALLIRKEAEQKYFGEFARR